MQNTKTIGWWNNNGVTLRPRYILIYKELGLSNWKSHFFFLNIKKRIQNRIPALQYQIIVRHVPIAN